MYVFAFAVFADVSNAIDLIRAVPIFVFAILPEDARSMILFETQ